MFDWLKRLFGRTPIQKEPPSELEQAADYYRTIAGVDEVIYGNPALVEVPYRRIDLYIRALEKLRNALYDPPNTPVIRHPEMVTIKICDFYLDEDDCLVNLDYVPDRFYALAEEVIRIFDEKRQDPHHVSKLDYVIRATGPIVENLRMMAVNRVHDQRSMINS